ncbi:hypothetical protein FD68_002268, partial [Salmonella enterica subsp. enterica serovar Oranienburg]|nr:hypothetical protein [Salmonella enterica subsp. enterica serovar Oranienburg]
ICHQSSVFSLLISSANNFPDRHQYNQQFNNKTLLKPLTSSTIGTITSIKRISRELTQFTLQSNAVRSACRRWISPAKQTGRRENRQ